MNLIVENIALVSSSGNLGFERLHQPAEFQSKSVFRQEEKVRLRKPYEHLQIVDAILQ